MIVSLPKRQRLSTHTFALKPFLNGKVEKRKANQRDSFCLNCKERGRQKREGQNQTLARQSSRDGLCGSTLIFEFVTSTSSGPNISTKHNQPFAMASRKGPPENPFRVRRERDRDEHFPPFEDVFAENRSTVSNKSTISSLSALAELHAHGRHIQRYGLDSSIDNSAAPPDNALDERWERLLNNSNDAQSSILSSDVLSVASHASFPPRSPRFRRCESPRRPTRTERILYVQNAHGLPAIEVISQEISSLSSFEEEDDNSLDYFNSSAVNLLSTPPNIRYQDTVTVRTATRQGNNDNKHVPIASSPSQDSENNDLQSLFRIAVTAADPNHCSNSHEDDGDEEVSHSPLLSQVDLSRISNDGNSVVDLSFGNNTSIVSGDYLIAIDQVSAAEPRQRLNQSPQKSLGARLPLLPSPPRLSSQRRFETLQLSPIKKYSLKSSTNWSALSDVSRVAAASAQSVMAHSNHWRATSTATDSSLIVEYGDDELGKDSTVSPLPSCSEGDGSSEKKAVANCPGGDLGESLGDNSTDNEKPSTTTNLHSSLASYKDPSSDGSDTQRSKPDFSRISPTSTITPNSSSEHNVTTGRNSSSSFSRSSKEQSRERENSNPQRSQRARTFLSDEFPHSRNRSFSHSQSRSIHGLEQERLHTSETKSLTPSPHNMRKPKALRSISSSTY